MKKTHLRPGPNLGISTIFSASSSPRLEIASFNAPSVLRRVDPAQIRRGNRLSRDPGWEISLKGGLRGVLLRGENPRLQFLKYIT